MTNPEDLAITWLVDYLGSDATLSSMVNGIAPFVVWGTLPSPFVRIDRLEATDLVVVGPFRVWCDCLFHVRGALHWRGSGLPDRTDIDAIGDRIDELLQAHEETTATLEMHSYREEGEPDPAIVDGSDLWLQAGGLYRLRAKAL